MKKLLVAGIAAAAFCGAPAIAADMPVKAPVSRTVDPGISWTGCYVGGNVGGGWARDGWDNVGLPFARIKPDGFVGGGQVGCDYQFGSLVVGARGLFDWSGLKGRGPDLLIPGGGGFVEQSKITSFDTATARIGVVLQPNTLLYIDGGFATAKFKRTEFDPAGAIFFTSDSRHSGGTIGGGLEWLLGSNWSAFLEYDYLHFGKKHLTTSNGTLIDTIDPHINVVMVGLNYRFGSGGKGPVVAKY